MATCSQASLAYDLLLKKSSEKSLEAVASIASASTRDPEESSASSVAEPTYSGPETSRKVIPPRSSLVLLRNVHIHRQQSDAKMAELLAQTRKLSRVAFDEDCLQDITKKSHWKLTLLASDDHSVLCGFVVWKIISGALSIAKLAVPEEMRGGGFGKFIMEDAMKNAKKQMDVYEVCLSSLPAAVTFYQRLGFKAFTALKIDTDKDVVEGQVYMVKKLRPRRR
jgi:predicted N-acetyltransferase YhbS